MVTAVKPYTRLASDQIVLVAASAKGDRENAPRRWQRRIKEAFDHE